MGAHYPVLGQRGLGWQLEVKSAIVAIVCVVIGAAITAPWPDEMRGAIFAGGISVLLYLRRNGSGPPP